MKNTYIIILLGILLIGCKPVEKIVEVPVPQIKTEYVEREVLKYDSIYIYDNQIIKNDTVIQTKWEYRYKILYKDSIQIKTDTITIVKEVPVQVQVKYVPPIVKWLAIAGFIAIAALLFMALKK